MKTRNIIISLVILVVSTLPLMSQTSIQATGKWLGTLVVNELVKLRLGIEVSENEQAEFVSVIHSLDQGAFDIPIKSTLVSAWTAPKFFETLFSSNNGESAIFCSLTATRLRG